MNQYFRLRVRTKATNHYVCFSAGTQAKLDQLIWVKPSRTPINSRWKIIGTAQEGLSDGKMSKLDYLPGISALDLFSQRFVDAWQIDYQNEIDFLSCAVMSKSGNKYQFHIARCHIFDNIIDAEATKQAQQISPLAPIIFGAPPLSHLMARDANQRTISVVSNDFKSFCEKHEFKIDFCPVIYSIAEWIAHQKT